MIVDSSPPDTVAAANEIAVLLHEQVARLGRRLRSLGLPHGVTPERLSALAAIERCGPVSLVALAKQEMVRPATMSRMVSALVGEGLVKRRDDKNDGRAVVLTMTPKGRVIYRRARQQRLRHLTEGLELLTDEQLSWMRQLAGQLEFFSLLLDDGRA